MSGKDLKPQLTQKDEASAKEKKKEEKKEEEKKEVKEQKSGDKKEGGEKEEKKEEKEEKDGSKKDDDSKSKPTPGDKSSTKGLFPVVARITASRKTAYWIDETAYWKTVHIFLRSP